MADILAAPDMLFLGSRLKRLAERLQGGAARALVELDIPIQLAHLPLVYALAQRGMTVGQLAEAVGSTQPGVTRSIGQLLEQGLVASSPGEDRRERHLELTPAGEEVMATAKTKLWPRVLSAMEELCAPLSATFEDDLARLEAGLALEPLEPRIMRDRSSALRLIDYRDDHAADFRAINVEWIEAMFALEPRDLQVLDSPRERIVEPGWRDPPCGACISGSDWDRRAPAKRRRRVRADQDGRARDGARTEGGRAAGSRPDRPRCRHGRTRGVSSFETVAAQRPCISTRRRASSTTSTSCASMARSMRDAMSPCATGSWMKAAHELRHAPRDRPAGHLPIWQKLNATVFLAIGIADAAPKAMGEPYLDADGARYARLLRQPLMVHAAEGDVLRRVRQQERQRDLQCAVYVGAMFEIGHDAANREAFLAESTDTPDLVGIAVRGPSKDNQKAVKGAPLQGC